MTFDRTDKTRSGVRVVAAMPRILLVEDDPLLARAMARHLWNEQYRLKFVSTCEDAYEAGLEFDVGVFDIELPDGNGVELASELIEEGTVDRAVFFSGVEHEAVVREAMKVGTFVHKRQGLEVLSHVLEATYRVACGRRRAQHV